MSGVDRSRKQCATMGYDNRVATMDKIRSKCRGKDLRVDGGVTSYGTEPDETHDCGTNLIRVDADDPENTHRVDVVACPVCLALVRKE